MRGRGGRKRTIRKFRRGSRTRAKAVSRQPQPRVHTQRRPSEFRVTRAARSGSKRRAGAFADTSVRRTSRVSSRLRDRRARVLASRKTAATKRVPSSVVSTLRAHEDAPRKSAAKACTRRKETRRAVIMATGYGGRNGVRRYAKRRPC